MADIDLPALRAAESKATPGPWRVGVTDTNTMDELVAHMERSARAGVEPRAWMLVHPDDYVPPEEGKAPLVRSPAWTGNGPTSEANAEFIALARNALPSLLAHVAAQAERIEALEGALRDVADFQPVMRLGAERGKWCWCGDPFIPTEHQPYCEAARRVLGGEEGT